MIDKEFDFLGPICCVLRNSGYELKDIMDLLVHFLITLEYEFSQVIFVGLNYLIAAHLWNLVVFELKRHCPIERK